MTARIHWTGWTGAFLLMAVLPALASIPPWLSEPLRLVLMQAFDPLCHQIAERSPHVHGVQLAVCHRCYGILLGLASGPVFALIFRVWSGRNGRMLVIASIVPLALDWGLDILGVLKNTAETRLITGAIFGVVAGVLVARAMSWRRSNRNVKIRFSEVEAH